MKNIRAWLLIAVAVVVLTVCLFGCASDGSVSGRITITFETNEGGEIEPINVRKGEKLPKLTEPTREGCEFVGWFLDPEFNEAASTLIAPYTDSTYYAKWRNVQVPVAFIGAGGSKIYVYVDYGSDMNSTTVDIPEVPHMPGYIGKWETTSLENVKEAQTIRAVYELGVYSVTYHVNGNNYVSSEGIPGEYIIYPEDPKIENGYFYGWYYDEDFQKPCTEKIEEIGTENIDLYARIIDITDMNLYFTYSVKSGQAAITGLSSFGRDKNFLIVPEEIDGYPITAIDAFATTQKELSIIIPSSVKTIGKYAFRGVDIKSIDLGEGLFDIDEGAFSSCGGLSHIKLPASVTAVGNYAFADNPQLRSFEIAPESDLITMGKEVFRGDVLLESFTLPDNNSYKIYYDTFTGSGIDKMVVPEGNTEYISEDGVLYSSKDILGHESDSNNPHQTLIYVPPMKGNTYEVNGSTVYIAAGAFYGNSVLTEITLPQSVTEIGDYAVAECHLLEVCNLSANLKRIGMRAFFNSFVPVKFSDNGERETPETVMNIPVSVENIGEAAFRESNICKVVFAEDADAADLILPDEIFHSCKSLAYVALSIRTKEIGAYAFYNCRELSEFYFDRVEDTKSRLVKIDEHAFENCIILNNKAIGVSHDLVSIPNTVVYIGDYAFYMQETFDVRLQIDIPSTVKYIGNYAFSNTSVTGYIADTSGNFNFEYMGKGAFKNCKSLQNVTLPETATFDVIPYEAFYGCIRLGASGISVAPNIKTIEDFAFYGCTALTSLTFSYANDGTGIVSIGKSSFEGCTKLNYSTINRILPATLENLGERAFFGCTELTKIALPNNLKEIPKEAFANCTALTEIAFEESCITDTFGENCFANCTALESVTLPPALSYRYSSTCGAVKNPFVGCKNLTVLDVSGGNHELYSSAGVVYTMVGSSVGLYLYPTGKEGKFSVPKSVNYIDEYAFYGVSGMTELAFESGTSVTADDYEIIEIGEYAFAKSALTQATFNYRVGKIGNYAFYDSAINKATINDVSACNLIIGDYAFARTEIEEINIQKRVVEIGEGAFADCYLLRTVKFNDVYGSGSINNASNSPLAIKTKAFSGDSKISEIIIPQRTVYIGDYAFENCRNIMQLSFEGSAHEGLVLGDYVFKSNHYLMKAELPSNLLAMGEGVFYDCSRLAYVEFGDSILQGTLSISDYAFYGCYDLQRIILPTYITSIGKGAFENSHIFEVEFSEAEENGAELSIEESAFRNTVNLTDIVLPYRLISIGSRAFYGSGLNNIEILEGKTVSVGDYAFAATKIEELTLSERVNIVGKGAFADTVKLVDFTYKPRVGLAVTESTFENSGIQKITFEGPISAIGAKAFRNTKRLTELRVTPGSVFTIGERAFESSAVSSVKFDFATQENFIVGSRAFFGASDLQSITITSDRVSVGDFAFSESGIKNLDIVATYAADTIGDGIAYGTKYLSEIHVFDGSGKYYTDGGVLFRFEEHGKNTLMQYPSGKIGASLIIHENTAKLGPYSLCGNTYLTTITVIGGQKVVFEENALADTGRSLTLYAEEEYLSDYADLPINVTSIQEETGGFVLDSVGSEKYAIVGYTGEAFDIDIVNKITVGGYTFNIVEIAKYAFLNNAKIRSVNIGAGICSVGDYAFANAINLQYVYIGDNVTDIKSHAFDGCGSLEYVGLGKTVSLIYPYAFYNCHSLSSIDMSESSVTDIGAYSFARCLLSEVMLGEKLEVIGNCAFATNPDLFSVKIPASVSKIGEYVFKDCENMIAIYIDGKKVPEIRGERSFADTSDSMRILVDSGMVDSFKTDSDWWSYSSKILSYDLISKIEGFENYILEENFDGYTLLFYLGAETNPVIRTDLAEQGTITATGEYAFSHFAESVVLEEGIKRIGASTFRNAVNMTSISVADSVTIIDSYAFFGLERLEEVFFGADSRLGEISSYAFSGCTGMSEFTLPKRLDRIGSHAFYCDRIRNFDVKINSYDKRNDTDEDGTVYTLTIEEYAFAENRLLKEITFDCVVAEIGDRAFADCSGLFSIYLKNNDNDIGATEIGKDAFLGCNLLCVYVPDGRWDSYWQNDSWKKITADRNRLVSMQYIADDISNETDGNIIKQKGFVIKVSASTGSNSASIISYIGDETELTFPKEIIIKSTKYTITSIGRTEINNADYTNGCVIGPDVTSVIIPEKVTTITADAFNGAEGLQTVRYEKKSHLTVIERNAFANCSKLTSVYLPYTVNTIGIGAFANDTALKTFVVAVRSFEADVDFNYKEDDELLAIKESAFENSGLESISFPIQLKSIGDYAFYRCERLKSVSLAQDGALSKFGDYVFAKTALESIVLPKTLETAGNYTFADCLRLQSVYMNRYLPGAGKYQITETGLKIFDGIDNPFVRVYVPREAYDTYSSTYNGKNESNSWNPKKTILPDLRARAYMSDGSDGGWFNYMTENGTEVKDDSAEIILTAYLGDSENVVIPGHLDINGNICKVTAISGYFGNERIKTVTFDEDFSGNTLEESVFAGCTALRSAVLPDTITNLGARAFQNCSSLTDVTLSNGLSSVPTYCFVNCISLREIILPPNISEIAEVAFMNCTSLSRLTIRCVNSEAKPLGNNAFTDTSEYLMIIVPEIAEGGLVESYKSQWSGYSNRIFSFANVYGDFIVKLQDTSKNPEDTYINADEYILQPNAGNKWKDGYILLQYCGNAEVLDLRETLNIDGKEIVSVVVGAMPNGTRVIFEAENDYGKFLLRSNDSGFTLLNYEGEEAILDLREIVIEGKKITEIADGALPPDTEVKY